jgi:hypothetical protein
VIEAIIGQVFGLLEYPILLFRIGASVLEQSKSTSHISIVDLVGWLGVFHRDSDQTISEALKEVCRIVVENGVCNVLKRMS